MADYFNSLRNAWHATSKNKSLLMAYILQTLANLFLFAIVFIPQMPYLLSSIDSTTPAVAIANKTLLLFILFSIIDLSIMIVFNAWFKAGIFGMLNAVVEKKKPTASIFFQSAKQLWKAFLAYQIVRFALVFCTALPLAVILSLYVVSGNSAFIIPLILAAILFFCGWFLLSASLFFAIPGVVKRKISAMAAISESLSLFKNQKPHVVKSFLIYFCLMLLTVILSILTLPLTSWLETIGADNSWRYVLAAAQFIIISLIAIIATIFMLDMYRKSM